jgi:LmbE family N-acetylglucosaminyl deacetylase
MSLALQFDRNARLMVLAVHPDDESIAAGGLIQQALAAGANVRIVFITDGDNNPWPQRYIEKRWTIARNDRMRWGRRRREEALSALGVLGVKPEEAVFLGLPDQGLTDLLLMPEPHGMKALEREIVDWQPSLLVVPSMHDLHPDHNATSVATDIFLRQWPPASVLPRILTYLVHGDANGCNVAESVQLSPVQLLLKRVAILSHDSQMKLGSWRFLKHARPRECFLDPEESSAGQCNLLKVAHDEHEIRIRCRLSRSSRLFGKPCLYIVTDTARLKLDLAHPRNAMALIDCIHGRAVGKVQASMVSGVCQVTLPREFLPGAQQVYFKLSRGIGFFDAAGWRPYVVQVRPARETVDTVAIIPCFNVEDYCEPVIAAATQYADRVIVIDDGSSDRTGEMIARLVRTLPDKIVPISFPENRGKGVGLMAGFQLALERYDFQALITLDADGQHPPAYIASLRERVASDVDMVVGERDISRMPGRSKLGNTLASGMLRRIYPAAPVDTQSGMRGFNQRFAAEIAATIEGSRYETEFQILLLALSRRRSIASVTIPTVYLDNNRSSKFRPVMDSLRIFGTLILWRLGFGPKAVS